MSICISNLFKRRKMNGSKKKNKTWICKVSKDLVISNTQHFEAFTDNSFLRYWNKLGKKIAKFCHYFHKIGSRVCLDVFWIKYINLLILKKENIFKKTMVLNIWPDNIIMNLTCLRKLDSIIRFGQASNYYLKLTSRNIGVSLCMYL